MVSRGRADDGGCGARLNLAGKMGLPNRKRTHAISPAIAPMPSNAAPTKKPKTSTAATSDRPTSHTSSAIMR